MKTYYLKNETGSLRGAVLPDYGGMMSELYFNDIPVFYFDPAMIGVTSVLAGGNPLLFPFPSRTKDDLYEWNGKQYSMPFHGIVKGGQFGLKEKSGNRVTLFFEPGGINKRENYPFDFRLEVTYILHENRADFIATVFNNSQEEMPHCFGWHPWFSVRDRSEMTIKTCMKRYMDYSDGSFYEESDPPDLMKRTDYVFDGRYGSETVVDSGKGGYRVCIDADEAFDVLVVNTEFDYSFPVEPWTGLPDSINTGKYVKFVPPGEQRAYRMTLRF